MAQVINSNVMSLNAQRNLNKSSGSLSTALQRLSSGLRINSSMDDAAGVSKVINAGGSPCAKEAADSCPVGCIHVEE